MIIVRWSLQTQFAATDKCIGILKEWAADVGERTGWKIGSMRVLRGAIGPSETEVEIESHFDGLGELESAWQDMQGATRHKDYMHRLQSVVSPGTSRWSVYREVDLGTR